MAYLAVREEDWALLDTLDALQTPEDRTAPTQEAGRLFSGRDTVAQQAFMERMAETTSWEPFDAAMGASQVARPDIARQLATMALSETRPPMVRAAATVGDAILQQHTGHWPGLDAPCGIPPAGQTSAPPLDQPACALLPFAPVPEADLETLRQRVSAWPAEPADVVSDDPQVALAPHAREFILGIIDSRLGDDRAALAAADRLQDMETIERWQPTVRALARTLRAEVAARTGQPEQTLEQLGDTVVLPPIEVNGPTLGRDLERWWRAEALFETGQDRQALDWYRNGFAFSRIEGLWIPMIELRSAQINERIGEREAAAIHYARFIRMWSDADPTLMHLVEEARTNLGRLAGEGGGG
jgi:hypothetical protein